LYLYGNPQTMTILSGYIGFVLLGMACLAIGQLCSAFTENQIIAALVTAAVLLGFWFVGPLGTVQASFAVRGFVRYLSFRGHYAAFTQGTVRSDAVVFYLIVSAIALALNAAYLEWRR